MSKSSHFTVPSPPPFSVSVCSAPDSSAGPSVAKYVGGL